jgi:hypothetical protein
MLMETCAGAPENPLNAAEARAKSVRPFNVRICPSTIHRLECSPA